jgi:excisionase family DNA binding protein
MALTIADVKQTARICKTRVYELIAAGELRAVKCGRRTLIDAQSLRDYLASLPRLPAKGA